MGMFKNAPPNLPDPSVEYDRGTMARILNTLRLYFNNLNAVQNLNVATLNINVDTLPTDADFATLRSGDIYRDSGLGNVIKIKL
jgi:hypothetical protein